jgi:hypothetical protein
MEKNYVSRSVGVTKMLIDLAEKAGYDVCETFKKDAETGRWPVFHIRGKKVIGRKEIDGDDEVVSLDIMVDILTITTILKLNSDYTAVINKVDKTVTFEEEKYVDCQTFSFDVLRTLVGRFD